MNQFLSKAAFFLALGSMASIGQAQSPTASVTGGTTTLQLNAAFVNGLRSLGATITDLHSNALVNNSVVLPAVTGAIDTLTLEGEVEHTFGVIINANGNIIRVENFTLDNTNPAAPSFTADFIFFSRFQGRFQVFNFERPNGVTASADLFQENGLTLTLAAPTVATMNALFGAQVLQTGTLVGTANVNTVLAPTN